MPWLSWCCCFCQTLFNLRTIKVQAHPLVNWSMGFYPLTCDNGILTFIMHMQKPEPSLGSIKLTHYQLFHTCFSIVDVIIAYYDTHLICVCIVWSYFFVSWHFIHFQWANISQRNGLLLDFIKDTADKITSFLTIDYFCNSQSIYWM